MIDKERVELEHEGNRHNFKYIDLTLFTYRH